MVTPLCLCLLLLPAAPPDGVAARPEPSYPRIANCYGAGLSWGSWEKGREYWSRLDLFIGGGYDLHYDWDHERWPEALERIEATIARIREVNPSALFLPYVDVVEGPDNPGIATEWWDLRDGERWSGWPGYYRIDTDRPEVLQYNLDRVREEVLGRPCFDGVFYDCWGPDDWLVPRTALLRDGAAIVMVNEWNLPQKGFAALNGCLAEDELNRVTEGTVEFEDFLARYLRWCAEGRSPVTTTIVCHPRKMNMDPWYWDGKPWQERVAYADSLRDSDPQMMRFGLTTTLLGDGYFAYDCANLGRGQWWWYPEFDAPLGRPTGPATPREDGVWERPFERGTVLVNGTLYDAEVELPRKREDISTDRVGTRFTLPSHDGRILLETDAEPSPGEDIPPTVTAQRPAQIRPAALADGTVVVQSPDGLELRFAATGELRRIVYDRRPVVSGGWPSVTLTSGRRMEAEVAGAPEVSSTESEVRLRFAGTLVAGDSQCRYEETCDVIPGGEFALRFAFEALTDLDVRLWRHYFFLPVRRYAGGWASDGTTRIALPETLAESSLLPGSTRVEFAAGGITVAADSSVPMSLVDHRKWGTDDYLLAGYPVSGKVAAGTTWTVEVTVQVGRS